MKKNEQEGNNKPSGGYSIGLGELIYYGTEKDMPKEIKEIFERPTSKTLKFRQRTK